MYPDGHEQVLSDIFLNGVDVGHNVQLSADISHSTQGHTHT